MGNYLRQKYKEKPQAWGPVESVQRSLRINAERIGIYHKDIALAMPMWNPINQQDYSQNRMYGTNTGYAYNNNALEGSTGCKIAIPDNINIEPLGFDFTYLFRLKSTNVTTQQILFSKTNEAPYLRVVRCAITYSTQTTVACQFLLGNTAGEWVDNTVSLQATDRTKIINYCFVKQSTNNHFYVDKATTTVTGKQPTQKNTTDNFQIGSSIAVGSLLYETLICKIALNKNIILQLSDNPYQLWQRQGNVYFSIPGSAGGITLSLAGLTQSHSIDATSLTQKNTLSASSLLQAQTSAAVSLAQKHMLTTSDLSQAMTLEVPTLSMAVALIVQALNHANTLESLGLIQKHNLSIDNLAQLQFVDNLDLIQRHILSLLNLSQGQSLDESLNLIQKNTLSISDLIQTHNLTGITLALADMLSVANLLHSQSTNALDIVQAHSIAVNNLHHDQAIGSVNLAMAMLLEIAGLTHAHSVDDLTISFVNLLTVDNLGHTQDLGAMTLSQAHSLLIDNLQHNQDISSVSFITARGKVTASFTMATPGVSQSASSSNIGFQISTPSINFSME